VRLPNAERAIVDDRKIRDYLLSTEHPVGRFKATFFQSLGYSASDPKLLQEALLAHGGLGEAETGEASAYGQRYRVRGMLRGLAGRAASVVSVWIVPAGEEVPRFITAFPGGRA
jgi:hypothetical protein